MEIFIGLFLGLIPALAIWIFNGVESSEKELKVKNESIYKDALASEYKKLAVKYYNLYLQACEKLDAASYSQTRSSGTSWRTIMGFSKEQKLTKAIVNERYKKLAMIYHPDTNGSEYAMKLLNLAKEKADIEVK